MRKVTKKITKVTSETAKKCKNGTKYTKMCIVDTNFMHKIFSIVQNVRNFAADKTNRQKTRATQDVAFCRYKFNKMKKIILSVALMALAAVPAMAGGLLTNTNQNAAYVRQMSQNGIIDITGLYANPAGTAFLADGWHLSLNSQTAKQQRNIETTFPLFFHNQNNQNATHRFEGKAFAPVIPSFQLSYNHDKWSVNANFSLVGGGGKCEFDKGLGSFEALYAGNMAVQIPAAVNTLVGQQVGATLPGMVQGQVSQALVGMGIPQPYADGIAATTQTDYNVNSQMTGYGLDAYMKGRSYYFGLALGATYKFTDNLAGYVGLRGTYATCNYNGYVQDVKADYAYTVNYTYTVPANAQLGFPGTSGEGQLTGSGTQDLATNGLTLNADQTGFGVAPIIGLDWKINDHWNLAGKYEAPTKIVLKNSSEMNEYAQAQIAAGNATLGKFADGSKIREDIPGILALGAQYSPISSVRISAGFNEYFDKSAKKTATVGNTLETVKGAGIDSNTWEINGGVEWDVCKYITLSASYQTTNYGIAEDGMNDLSFNLSNQMVGAGLRINATERCSIDLGYMHTFYGDRTIDTMTAAGKKSDFYVRKNDVFGVGVNIAF